MQAQPQKVAQVEYTLPEISPAPRWSLAKRIAFRLTFAYFVLYNIPFPAGILPFTDTISQKYDSLWHAIVPWVGKHLLRLSYDITVFTNGSGDTTYNYIQVFCFLALAVMATAVWSGLDRRRANYERLYQWLRLYVRFALAGWMILWVYQDDAAANASPFLNKADRTVRRLFTDGAAVDIHRRVQSL